MNVSGLDPIDLNREYRSRLNKAVDSVDRFLSLHALEKLTVPDYICFRCATLLAYDRMWQMHERSARYLHQSIFDGRRVAYIELGEPVATVAGPLRYLFLMDTKPEGTEGDKFTYLSVYPAGPRPQDQTNYPVILDQINAGGAVNVSPKSHPRHLSQDFLAGDFTIRIERVPKLHTVNRDMFATTALTA